MPVEVPVEISPPAVATPRVISVKEIEGTLRRLRGVLACRVVCDAAGGIREVHAVAEAGRPAKMVVRDIESALRAQWSLSLDRSKISVAQIAPGQTEPAPLSRPRLRLVSAQVTSENGQSTAQVVLRPGDAPDTTGTATAPDGEVPARVLTNATLRAVEAYRNTPNRLRLADVTTVVLGDQTAVVLLVALQTAKGDDLLTGSALVRGDGDRAVVAAALDAVNRRLVSLNPSDGAS